MEDTLKIKVSIGEISIELEGNTKIVLEKFDEIRANGLGNLIQTPITSNNQTIPAKKETKVALTENKQNQIKTKTKTSYPSLREINLKGSPKSEAEWILIYGFYAGNFGGNEFTRDNLIQKYADTKRETKSRKANLSNNLKNLLKQGKIRFLNDEDIILIKDGLAIVKEILER